MTRIPAEGRARAAELARAAWRAFLAEKVGVVVFAGAAAGLLSFLEIADDMAEGDTRGVDEALMLMLRDPGELSEPVGPAWVKTMAMDFTSLGSLAVLGLIVLLLAGLFLALRRRLEAALIVASAGGGLALSQGLKAFFDRDRPDPAWHAVEAVNASFPSGHAMLSAVVFLTLGALVSRFATRRRIRAWALGTAMLLTLLVGLSRVYLGVHWPSDVLAGWCLGSAWAGGCWLAAFLIERRAARRARFT
ncbi:MAG TPA: phosphatase PAP2 family protein [Phenylobacterium sp.]|nr:phosphatase PAP2 family protein [Phenylobacterium sp.]